MEFDHEEHARTGHNLLRTSEELIETLEENQVLDMNKQTKKLNSMTRNRLDFQSTTSQHEYALRCSPKKAFTM